MKNRMISQINIETSKRQREEEKKLDEELKNKEHALKELLDQQLDVSGQDKFV